jgi:ATP/maltotriose-dependent transcriptional regulator MalT/DNA-binding SARP family transcriptional activator
LTTEAISVKNKSTKNVEREVGITKPAPIAKITYPVFKGILPRTRLFRHLENSRDRPIIWVSGPPGSGKTTLVASYLDSCKIPSLWYKVDEGDADIATFFYYMSLAVKRAVPQKRKPLPLLTPEYLQGITTFTKRYFENLFSRLNPSTPPFKKGDKGGFIIVFDNYQQVPAGSKFHEVIRDGLSVIPEKINIIVMSRGSLPKQLVRWQANNKISFLGWDEIRFTLDESREIVRMKGRKELTEEAIIQLHKKTEGWAAGLVLMMEIAKIKNIDYQLLNKFTPEEIFDYFLDEIFNKTDRETQEFLLKTSFLPKITTQMAEKLTGISKSGQILSDLNQNNYFTKMLSSTEPVYQYHPLFVEFLLSRARDYFAYDEISMIKRSAAMLLEEDGQVEDAARLLLDAKDWDGFVRIILSQAKSLIAQGRSKTLQEWIMHIPEEILGNTPYLLYWLGVCRMPFNPNESLPYFEKAFHQFKNQRDAAGIFLSLSDVLDSISHSFSAFQRFDQWISIFYELLSEYKEFPSKEIEARVINSMLYAFMLRQPQHPDYETWSERALAITKDIGDINIRMHTLMPLVGYRLFSGELSKAKLMIDSFRGIIQSSAVTQLVLIWLKDEEAVYYRETANFEECHKSTTEGLKLASESGVHFMDHFLLGNGAAGALSTGEMGTAKKYLHDLSLYLGRMPLWAECHYYTLETWSALLQKNLSKALSHANMALKLSGQVGMPQTEAIYHLGKALVMHELGKEGEALEHIAEARKICSSVKILQVEFGCLLAEAQFAFDCGDDEQGVDFLRKAMAIGKEQGYVTTDFWIPSVMAKLCVKALEASIEVEYVQNLVRRRNIIPDSPPFECDNWPWPLKIFTFGRFGLLKDGKPLRFSGKVQHKALSMLKALIALGGREVKEDRLVDILWSEAEGDAAHSAFTTTLSRLRHFLGIEKAIKFQEGKATLDPCYCCVDAWAFERILGQVETAWKERPTESDMINIIQMAEKAIKMYTGPFLSGDTEPWMISLRERLRNKFLRNVGRLGHYYELIGELNKAVDYYQKGLEVDDLAEEFYQRLIKCYHQMGRRAEALSIYKRCCQILSSVLGIEPSQETEAIYKALKS